MNYLVDKLINGHTTFKQVYYMMNYYNDAILTNHTTQSVTKVICKRYYAYIQLCDVSGSYVLSDNAMISLCPMSRDRD